MKLIVSYFTILLYLTLYKVEAQIVSVNVKVDGFTCSMCAKSVENSIRKLDFVENVSMNLNDNSALVTFRKNKPISIFKLADKVYDSGFSIHSITAEYLFNNVSIDDYSIINENMGQFCFIETGILKLDGIHTIIFLNKSLISRKEFNHWEQWTKEASKKIEKNTPVYYVTLFRKE